MEQNIYQPPEASLVVEDVGDTEFYVVSRKKLLILYVATFGLYIIYWFFENWRSYKRKHNKSLWPVPRSLFYVFFTHSLFRLFHDQAKTINPEIDWNHKVFATICVLFSIVSSILDKLSEFNIGEPFASIASILSIVIVGWVLFRAQIVANIACNDPDAMKNDRLTVVNYLWILLGLGLWVLIGYGIYVILTGDTL